MEKTKRNVGVSKTKIRFNVDKKIKKERGEEDDLNYSSSGSSSS